MKREAGLKHGDLAPLIGAARWMQAMESGDIDGGAIPLGMVVGLIDDLPSCGELIARIVQQARTLVQGRLPAVVGQ